MHLSIIVSSFLRSSLNDGGNRSLLDLAVHVGELAVDLGEGGERCRGLLVVHCCWCWLVVGRLE